MATQNAELVLTAQKSIDGKQYKLSGLQHVPYASSAEIISTVPSTRRHRGQIFYVLNGGVIEIWQFVAGIADGNIAKIFPQTIAITADNGLTLASGNVKLGGTLTADTIIAAAAHKLNITDATPSSFSDYVVNINTTGAGSGGSLSVTTDTDGHAIYATSSTGTGVSGQALSTGTGVNGSTSNGVGVQAIGSGGTGLLATAQDGLPAKCIITPSSNNANVRTGLTVVRSHTAAGGTGAGISIDLQVIDSGSTERLSNQLISKWTTATSGSRTSEFSIIGVNNATTQTLLTISGAGIFSLTQGLNDYVDDAAAAAGTPSIPVKGLYRTGSIVKMRVS